MTSENWKRIELGTSTLPRILAESSFHLYFLSSPSGYDGLPFGLRHLLIITAGMRGGLVQNSARLDPGPVMPGPHSTPSLTTRHMVHNSFKVCYRPRNSQGIQETQQEIPPR